MTVPSGKLALMWLNTYASVVIKTSKLTAIFDPVGIKPDQYNTDVIIVTHEHSDHFDVNAVTKLCEQSGATVITTPFVAHQLKHTSNVKPLQIGDSVAIGGVKFHAEYSDHPANQPLSFMLMVEDGITVYHPSDSKPYAMMKELGQKYQPDMLLYLGVSPECGAEIAKLVQPKVIVSCHLDSTESGIFSKRLAREVPEIIDRSIRPFEIYQCS